MLANWTHRTRTASFVRVCNSTWAPDPSNHHGWIQWERSIDFNVQYGGRYTHTPNRGNRRICSTILSMSDVLCDWQQSLAMHEYGCNTYSSDMFHLLTPGRPSHPGIESIDFINTPTIIKLQQQTAAQFECIYRFIVHIFACHFPVHQLAWYHTMLSPTRHHCSNLYPHLANLIYTNFFVWSIALKQWIALLDSFKSFHYWTC